MASLVAKKKGNQLYYYLVESARVDGHPRIVHQAYLGTAEKVAALVKDRTAPVPVSAASRAFGLPRPPPPARSPTRPRPGLRGFAGLRTARRALAGSPPDRPLCPARIALACATLRALAGPLPVARGHPSRLPARTQNRSGRLVSQYHFGFR